MDEASAMSTFAARTNSYTKPSRSRKDIVLDYVMHRPGAKKKLETITLEIKKPLPKRVPGRAFRYKKRGKNVALDIATSLIFMQYRFPFLSH